MSQSQGIKFVLHRGRVTPVEILTQVFIGEHLHYTCQIGNEVHTYPHTHIFDSEQELNDVYNGGVDARKLFLGSNENLFG